MSEMEEAINQLASLSIIEVVTTRGHHYGLRGKMIFIPERPLSELMHVLLAPQASGFPSP